MIRLGSRRGKQILRCADLRSLARPHVFLGLGGRSVCEHKSAGRVAENGQMIR